MAHFPHFLPQEWTLKESNLATNGLDARAISHSRCYRSGAGGTRTPYLFNAIEALSQMSYSPTRTVA